MSKELALNITTLEMPRWLCHKEVNAFKIYDIKSNPNGIGWDILAEDIFGCVTVSDHWLKKHDPKVGGYFVVYEDGYQSYSPAGPFEAGYTRI